MISVIVPAHNEEAVIARSLDSLTRGAGPGDLDIIVVCNGCRDATAAIARAFGRGVRVIETDVPSKANALNLGDEAATSFPRVYLDADVILSFESVREIALTLGREHVLAAAPAVKTVFPPDTTWAVRAYYEFWMALPYVKEGMMAAGVYAVNREGRKRFERFPNIIADDGYFRLQYTSAERVEVPTAVSTVSAPANIWDLVRIKTRSRLGGYQLRSQFPALFLREAQSKHYGRSIGAMASSPRLWPAAFPYLWVNVVSRWRAKSQAKAVASYVWERDNSSRAVSTHTPS